VGLAKFNFDFPSPGISFDSCVYKSGKKLNNQIRKK
jgi:hypothetical protein